MAGNSALAVLARRAASACMAVATVVGVVEAAPAWAEESAEFPQTMHFAVSMANMNLSENDLPAFRYGFSGFREANPTVPVYTNSQFEEGAGVLPRAMPPIAWTSTKGLRATIGATRGIR